MRHFLVLLCWLTLAAFISAMAALANEEIPPVVTGDPDWAAGRAAFEGQDWQGVVDNMAKVVARRPWDDNAQNLLGFAYRKLQNYRQALAHYHKALDLNPHHRGALEYLGETYVAMGCVTEARNTLGRLEAACRRLATSPSTNWQADCEEWRELQEAIDAPRGAAPPQCSLD